ncbi:MAG: hypothetical protein NVSMB49_20500 [Ktedonobacteraceae bacterium]
MATACTFCGHELPRDDAHFCNNCGMLVPSHPFSAQSLSASGSASPLARREQEKPALREQMVHQGQSRAHATRHIAPDNLAASPITHASVNETSFQADNERPTQKEQPSVQTISSRPMPAERELHVKIWEQEQHNPSTPLPESKSEALTSDVENTPTVPLATPEYKNIGDVSTDSGVNTHRAEVEHIDTITMPDYGQMSRAASQQSQHASHSMPGNTPLPPHPIEQRRQEQALQGHMHTPLPYTNIPRIPTGMPQAPQSPRMQTSPVAYIASLQEKRISGTTAASQASSHRQKSRVPFVLLLALLGILVLGIGAWAILAQPFSIPTVTQPLQDFKDTGLGVALSYPSGWSTQHDATGVLFFDSSHTAQVKLAVANNVGGDASQYVQQQATKNGMIAIKPLATRSFAGIVWQQIQGNMQQNGANYTATMFAAVHGNRMYVLTQMAPQNVYAEEESVVFSAIRGSFNFL